ncbi:hypothetical protein BGZ73_003494 [Actinomortierella ambigua]|nr:hypothetical protein BGZ73_003494 [Actinomortierella ambigua]
MTTYNQRDPTCVHSKMPHNTMSFSSADAPWSCPCEDCTMNRPPANVLTDAEQRSFFGLSSSANGTTMMAPLNITSAQPRSNGQNARASPTINTTTKPVAILRRSSSISQEGGPSSPTSAIRERSLIGSTVMHSPPQRRSSFEYHDSGRVFMQHSSSCDCGGSGVGCACSYSCSC